MFFISFVPLVCPGIDRAGILARCHSSCQALLLRSLLSSRCSSVRSTPTSIQQDLSYGGARYIGTGRGFRDCPHALRRILYSRFRWSLHLSGVLDRLMMLLLFGTLITVGNICSPVVLGLSGRPLHLALRLQPSPVLRGPTSSSTTASILRWLSRGNTKVSLLRPGSASVRLSRTSLTGFKRKVSW